MQTNKLLIALRLLHLYQHLANANQKRLYQLSNLIQVAMLVRSQIRKKKMLIEFHEKLLPKLQI